MSQNAHTSETFLSKKKEEKPRTYFLLEDIKSFNNRLNNYPL